LLFLFCLIQASHWSFLTIGFWQLQDYSAQPSFKMFNVCSTNLTSNCFGNVQQLPSSCKLKVVHTGVTAYK
jgi:hypothetical protein